MKSDIDFQVAAAHEMGKRGMKGEWAADPRMQLKLIEHLLSVVRSHTNQAVMTFKFITIAEAKQLER